MARCQFIPLRNYSTYSLLQSALSISSLLNFNKKNEYAYPALGLCDVKHFFGAMEFSLNCIKEHVQPIIGVTLKIFMSELDHIAVELPVYAMNQIGYQNLCQLITKSTVGQDERLYEHLLIDQLEGLTEGLLVLAGGRNGVFKEHHNIDAQIAMLNKNFADRWYIEINRQAHVPGSYYTNEDILIDIAYTQNVPLLATHEVFYTTASKAKSYDILRGISEGITVNDEKFTNWPEVFYFPPQEEILETFSDLPEALEQTIVFAKRCHFLLEITPPKLPQFEIPTSENGQTPTPDEYLRLLTQQGLKGHGFDQNQEYLDRLDYECRMITRTGFAGYFLIVADFIQWAKAQQIPVGPGRGSGASSLVAWCLSITDIDPLRYQLLFERFLNPDRVSLPDFDIDFCQTRRDEVIHYVQQKYGADRVAHIITFGKLQARMVLRDVGRVMGLGYGYVDKICKLVPHNPSNPVSLKEARVQEPQLNQMAEDDSQIMELLDTGEELEGIYRHASVHAAGVVIASVDITKIVPLYQDPGSSLPATEFNMSFVEKAGLVKFDFLGLKTLTVLDDALKLVKKHDNIVINLSTIPLDDEKTFKMLCRGDTIGVFQLESAGMTEVLRRLQPTRFEEIIALVALYRPGPMQDIADFIDLKHGRKKIMYDYPIIEPILRETFSIIVYQEQVLQIAQQLAGYTLGQADLLRRAMGKKIAKEMEEQREKFVKGVQQKYPSENPDKAVQLFDKISRFAAYAFNKAHAASYALISYQTAYIKANFTEAFMAATMSHEMHNTDKLSVLIRECKKMGIEVLKPCVQHSFHTFSLEEVKKN